MSLIVNLIEKEEGWRDTPYYCKERYPTVGYGFKLADKDAPLPKFKLPKAAGDAWLATLLAELNIKLMAYDWYVALNTPRRAIIMSMAYQLGLDGLLKFKKMIKAISSDLYYEAAREMLDSLWAKQTPERAKRHALQMTTGVWSSYYD